jgi:hypothetical protein
MKKDAPTPPNLSAKPETESLKKGVAAVNQLYQQIRDQMSHPPSEAEIQMLCDVLNGIRRRADELLISIMPRG